MTEFLKDNGIAIFSLFIAIIALFLNRKNSKLNSYDQHGSYLVFFQKESKLRKWLYGSQFSVKVNNSIMSDVIEFEYILKIKPLLGGIYRTYLFEDIGKNNFIGTTRTLPVIRTQNNKSKFLNKYAHQNMINFSSTPIYSYFSVNDQFNEEKRYFENRLCRYHKYIEITDYRGHTEIWYVSFSLHLSNLEENKSWKKCPADVAFKYYKFDQLNIVSPRDIPANLNRALQFNKDLSMIAGCKKDSIESKRFTEQGFHSINSELLLYEVKEYIQLLDRIKKYI